MLTALSLSAISAAAIMFYSRRLLCYLRHFQDNDYSPRLFKEWLVANGVYDRKGSFIATIAALILEISKENDFNSLIICLVAAVALTWMGLKEVDPRTAGYPILQPTQQARSIYHLGLNLFSIFLIGCITTVYFISADDDMAAYWLVVIVAIQSSPVWLLLANAIVSRRQS
jgi:UDP-N-acetylmuramoyl-tripeptide--D-alanyl-D-alanine ligase